MARRYRKSRREEAEAATRQRIVDATVELHGSLGPRHTTISEIARRAGVQRLTVYRHFPTEVQLFDACTSCWSERNPFPDMSAWAGESDPRRRFRAAVEALYEYYQQAGSMLEVSLRDESHVESVKRPMQEFRAAVADIADDLIRVGGADEAESATIRHALAYSTWKQLSEQGLSSREAVLLVSNWVAGVSRKDD